MDLGSAVLVLLPTTALPHDCLWPLKHVCERGGSKGQLNPLQPDNLSSIPALLLSYVTLGKVWTCLALVSLNPE